MPQQYLIYTDTAHDDSVNYYLRINLNLQVVGDECRPRSYTFIDDSRRHAILSFRGPEIQLTNQALGIWACSHLRNVGATQNVSEYTEHRSGWTSKISSMDRVSYTFNRNDIKQLRVSKPVRTLVNRGQHVLAACACLRHPNIVYLVILHGTSDDIGSGEKGSATLI